MKHENQQEICIYWRRNGISPTEYHVLDSVSGLRKEIIIFSGFERAFKKGDVYQFWSQCLQLQGNTSRKIVLLQKVLKSLRALSKYPPQDPVSHIIDFANIFVFYGPCTKGEKH